MLALLLSIFRFVLLSGRQAIAIENAALRLQLAAFQRERTRPVLTTFDRVFWIALRRLWSGWRRPWQDVQADTVARWQRERFRTIWARLSKRHGRRRGRPTTAVEIRWLIEQMVVANPLWRASRTLRGLRRPPSQTWKTFLRNHLDQSVSIDFFTVPTITMKVLFVFIVLEHRRRQVLHFNVTEHPTPAWTSQQIVEALADRDGPRHLIRNRDSIYGDDVRLRMSSIVIRQNCVRRHVITLQRVHNGDAGHPPEGSL
jgi:putative transposase